MRIRILSLSLLLTLSPAQASVSPAEAQAMSSGYISFQRGDWQQCVDTFAPLIKQNPSLANEMAKPSVSNNKAGEVLSACQDGLAQAAVESAPGYSAAQDFFEDYVGRVNRDGMETTEHFAVLTECLKVGGAALKSFPTLATMKFGPSSYEMTGQQILAKCQKDFPAVQAAYQKDVQTAASGLNAELAKLRKLYDQLASRYAAATKLPESTPSQKLVKEDEVGKLVINVENLSDRLATLQLGNVSPQALKAGSDTYPAFVKKVADLSGNTGQLYKRIEAQAKPIQDKLNGQVRDLIGKFSSGDRLGVYQSRGYPSTLGGTDLKLEKAVVDYSVDPTPKARLIATASVWLYELPYGCVYRYYFKGNTLQRLEKTNCL